MISVNGTLFVTGQQKHVLATLSSKFWNGLSMLDGTTPSFSPVSGQGEIWSAGTSEGDKEANPESCEVVLTRGGANERWLFVANYCGPDAAGMLLVQRITNLSNVDFTERHLVDMFDLLADYASPTSGPPPSPRGPLGDEVDRSFYTAAAGSKQGNKMRSMHAVRVPVGFGYENEGETLVFTLLNGDPLRLNYDALRDPPYYYDIPPEPMDDGVTSDDLKYDYVAITDITKMVPPVVPPELLLPGYWAYDDEAAWAAHTTFLRLPPDLPVGWDINNTNNPVLDPGRDWSWVTVSDPVFGVGDPADPDQSVQIVGSGTPSSITSHPDRTHVYITTVDQGGNEWPDDPKDHDGGWHASHLFIADLTLPGVSFTNQADMNLYADQAQANHVKGFRFNKIVRADFSKPGQPNTEYGAVTAPDTLGFPTGPIPPPEGGVYPGENWLELKGQSRLFTLHNDQFMSNKDRLYVGADGLQAKLTEPNAQKWLGAAGAVFSISIDDPDDPAWLRTLTLPQEFEDGVPPPNPVDGVIHIYQMNGLAVIPNQPNWAQAMARNVLVVTTNDTKGDTLGGVTDARNRLTLLQDPE